MEEIRQKNFKGERSLFASKNIKLIDCVFEEGESPLKESSDLELEGVLFRWKYPLWYSKNITLEKCTLTETARSGVW